jgi:hypothetical protein
MTIFYRRPNCILVNVGQSKPKFYRKPFHIDLLDYIYPRIARAKFHLKGQDNRSYPSLTCKLITKRESLKAQLFTKDETL